MSRYTEFSTARLVRERDRAMRDAGWYFASASCAYGDALKSRWNGHAVSALARAEAYMRELARRARHADESSVFTAYGMEG